MFILSPALKGLFQAIATVKEFYVTWHLGLTTAFYLARTVQWQLMYGKEEIADWFVT